MPCNSPNRVFYIGINRETGKRKTLFTSRNVDFIYRYNPHSKWITVYESDKLSPATLSARGYQVVTDHDDVPCGQCLGCRLDYARQWSARIMMEKKNYPDDMCWFVTLTYDDDHLPEKRLIPDKVDEVTGEIFTMKPAPFSSVSMREHQLFMKRLRKHFQPKTNLPIKFFASAEYGSDSYRCHYHYILFGVKLDDLQLYKTNRFGDSLYTSAELQSCWCDPVTKQPYGFITIGAVTIDSAGYCARYAIKKRKMTDKSTYARLGIDPEFVVMSRRPGLGVDYINNNYQELYLTDEMIIPGRDRPIKMKPPKYYDTVLERLNPDLYQQVKDHRKTAALDKENFIAEYMPFYDKEEVYKTKERLLSKKASVLRRRETDE